MKALVKKYSILKKYPDQTDQEINDLVVIEEPLEIRIQHFLANNWTEEQLLVTMRTPGNDFDLVIGFLYNEGIIFSADDILKIEFCSENKDNNIVKIQLKKEITFEANQKRNFDINSSCGICGKQSIEEIKCDAPPISLDRQLLVKESTVFGLNEKINQLQVAFKYTGGIHASALFDLDGNLECIKEDVGRHNALDKLIGCYLQTNTSLNNKILLVSGRVSYELCQKAIKAGIPILVAIGAPSSLAIDLAKEMNLTLCGFSSKNRFNLYNDVNRILPSTISK